MSHVEKRDDLPEWDEEDGVWRWGPYVLQPTRLDPNEPLFHYVAMAAVECATVIAPRALHESTGEERLLVTVVARTVPMMAWLEEHAKGEVS